MDTSAQFLLLPTWVPPFSGCAVSTRLCTDPPVDQSHPAKTISSRLANRDVNQTCLDPDESMIAGLAGWTCSSLRVSAFPHARSTLFPLFGSHFPITPTRCAESCVDR